MQGAILLLYIGYCLVSRSPTSLSKKKVGFLFFSIGIAAGNLVMGRLQGKDSPPEKKIIQASFIDGDSVADCAL